MDRDLKREREIAKAAGPLKMWTPTPEARTPRPSAKGSLRWLREQEQIKRELSAGIDGGSVGPEFE